MKVVVKLFAVAAAVALLATPTASLANDGGPGLTGGLLVRLHNTAVLSVSTGSTVTAYTPSGVASLESTPADRALPPNQGENRTLITVRLDGLPRAGTQFASTLLFGTCQTPGPVAVPLTTVASDGTGSSVTQTSIPVWLWSVIATAAADGGGLHLAVQGGLDESAPPMACGNVISARTN
ncbi:MAG: hypothetical protein HY329_08830 [Chloroflexi bacterium]|nr:hypothetical protein [Chloroflexota bacterium]